MIGELFILGFDGPKVPGWLRDFEARFGLGGVILFDYDVSRKAYDRNVHSRDQVRELCADIAKMRSRPLITVDQEGGKVRRLKEKLGFAPLPSAQAFNALSLEEKIDFVEDSFRELKALGFHINLAPVIDLNLNPENPDIGKVERSFSANADDVRADVDLLNSTAQEINLGLCLKHFPGLGGAKVNSHEELTDLSDVLTNEETELFFELLPDISGQACLISHGIVKQWDAEVPVSMSAAGLRRLREEMPDALLISDDLQMQALQRKFTTAEACERGLRAGLDMLCVGNNMMREEDAMFTVAERLTQVCETDAGFAERCRSAAEKVKGRKELFY